MQRRDFLRAMALGAAGSAAWPMHLDAWAAKPLRVGLIGSGWYGKCDLFRLIQVAPVEVVSLCDVDKQLLADAATQVAARQASKKTPRTYGDYRPMLAERDLDLVLIATPDHWHAYIAIAAIQAGKDVYCEKPLTYSIHEAVELVKAVRKTDRVFQTGSQQRSSKEFRTSAELIRNGVLGKISAVHVSFGDPAAPYREPAETMEPGLDWKMWCGPGPLVDYSPFLCPRGVHDNFPHWRKTWEFGGGMITDWGAHHIDIAQWALGFDGSGPVEVRAPQNWETAKRGAQLVYADGTVLTHVRGKGVSFYGTEGELHVNRGKFELIMDGKTVNKFWDKEVDKTTSLEREVTLADRKYLVDAKVKLPAPKSHFQDFMDSIASRKRPICDVEIGASSVIACHVMNFAYRYGANAKWDPKRNRVGSGGSNKWLTRDKYHGGWKV
jgi:predicted dehydrogenase